MPRKPTSRIFPQDDGTALVELTQGQFAIVDIDDVDKVANYKWHFRPSGRNSYAASAHGVPMHRVILDTEHSIDHINRNGLDNRRENLRPCTNTINKLNESKRKDNTSGDSGIHLRPWGKWQARIAVGNNRYSLGHFDNYGDAKFCLDNVRKIIADLLGEIKKVA